MRFFLLLNLLIVCTHLKASEIPDKICGLLERKVKIFVHVKSVSKNCTVDEDCKYVHSRIVEENGCNAILLGQESQKLKNLERVHAMYCKNKISDRSCSQQEHDRSKIVTVEASCEFNQCTEKRTEFKIPNK